MLPQAKLRDVEEKTFRGCIYERGSRRILLLFVDCFVCLEPMIEHGWNAGEDKCLIHECKLDPLKWDGDLDGICDDADLARLRKEKAAADAKELQAQQSYKEAMEYQEFVRLSEKLNRLSEKLKKVAGQP